MLTWQIDRFLRSGPLCAVATFIIPLVLAIIVDQVSEVENVLGIVLVASGIIFIGSLAGSVVTTGLGFLLFGLGAVLAELPTALLAVIGIGLYATLIVHDLAGTFRRAPGIKLAVWKNAAVVVAAVAACSAAAFAVTFAVANLATWQAIVVPFGVAAIGFTVKLAADAHVSSARALTAKRVKPAEEMLD